MQSANGAILNHFALVLCCYVMRNCMKNILSVPFSMCSSKMLNMEATYVVFYSDLRGENIFLLYDISWLSFLCIICAICVFDFILGSLVKNSLGCRVCAFAPEINLGSVPFAYLYCF
jgi:hypothetical protein